MEREVNPNRAKVLFFAVLLAALGGAVAFTFYRNRPSPDPTNQYIGELGREIGFDPDEAKAKGAEFAATPEGREAIENFQRRAAETLAKSDEAAAQVEDLFAKANENYESGNFQEALDLCNEALAIEKSSKTKSSTTPRLLNLAGLSLWMLGEHDEAINHLEEALAAKYLLSRDKKVIEESLEFFKEVQADQ
ncbi:tetratricopeptide repeat protein [Stratiformator vulcanicus]|uniref:Tetratricopeptide repeat protein n=1 Tax=Stratiformator vulcanicus TaxID=2527980 RepID=A0A517R7M9_9PLAN|nr:tetratricopeptide repeat protein [Stratiformator vulcanicus]QDT39897.1 Tetratricopeptide repeat protein [Stratiformator vulcanicus]